MTQQKEFLETFQIHEVESLRSNFDQNPTTPQPRNVKYIA